MIQKKSNCLVVANLCGDEEKFGFFVQKMVERKLERQQISKKYSNTWPTDLIEKSPAFQNILLYHHKLFSLLEAFDTPVSKI